MVWKKKASKIWQRTRVLRYLGYKRVGLEKVRNRVDVSVLFIIICVITLPLFLHKPKELREAIPVSPEKAAGAVEAVHGDLGDDEVVAEQRVSLSDLEKGVAAGAVELQTRSFEKGDSLLGILTREKVPSADRAAIVDALGLMIDLRSLKPGLQMFLFREKSLGQARGDVLGVSFQIKGTDTIAVIREDSGWTPFSESGRVETVNNRITGFVERTFSGTARKAGAPDGVVNQVLSALDGEVDFSTDIQAGDAFDIIYEIKKTPGGLELGGKQLVFVGLKLGKKEIYRYAWTDKSGLTTFYDARGLAGEKMIMKRPVKARARLSSGYGYRRHPVLGFEIFHSGIDLACPMNTPIVAAADGTIVQLGRKGAYGRYIRIRHAGGYETAYGHMNGYRQDLSARSKIKRGEVIGYVGNSGRSTGPHVHFEVWRYGKTVHPGRDNAIPSRQLSDFELEQFVNFASGVHADFERHRIGRLPPVPPERPDFI